MSYELNPRLFVENGPAVAAEAARRRSSAANFNRVWLNLPAERRLTLVESALKAA